MDSGISKNTKTIQISEEVFSVLPKKKGSRAKTLKKKARPVIDTAQLETQLMNNIKQRNAQVEPTAVSNIPPVPPPSTNGSIKSDNIPQVEKPISEYEDSLQFMKTLPSVPARKRHTPDKAKKITSITSNVSPISIPKIDTSTLSESKVDTTKPPSLQYKVDTDIPHGCLKNGLKTTYKNKTAKNTRSEYKVSFDIDEVSCKMNGVHEHALTTTNSPKIIIHDAVPSSKSEYYINPISISDNLPGTSSSQSTSEPSSGSSPTKIKTIRIDTGQLPSQSIGGNADNSETPISIPKEATVTTYRPMRGKRAKSIKTIRKTFRLGKNHSKRIVSVFCKNAEMITGLKKIHSTLKNVNLNEMKKYLVKKSLLSIGSLAPTDVIRQMYESAVGAGDIINHNDTLLLNNYIDEST